MGDFDPSTNAPIRQGKPDKKKDMTASEANRAKMENRRQLDPNSGSDDFENPDPGSAKKCKSQYPYRCHKQFKQVGTSRSKDKRPFKWVHKRVG